MNTGPGFTVSKARDSKDFVQQVARVVEAAAQLSVEPESYGRELYLDSVGIIQLIVGLEKEFGLVIDDEDVTLTAFKSIDSIAEYVYEKAAAIGGAGR